MDIDEFFRPYPESKVIFDRLWSAMLTVGEPQLRVGKTQIALVRVKPFAWAWVPEMHLGRKAAPLVLSFSFPEPRPWPRWKEIYRAGNRRYTHHVELWSPDEVDGEVREWLRVAWEGSARVASESP